MAELVEVLAAMGLSSVMPFTDALDRLAALARQGQEDTARLDWLIENLYAPGPDDGGWEVYRVAGSPDNPFNIQRQLWRFKPYKTLREAIDAARKAEGGEGTLTPDREMTPEEFAASIIAKLGGLVGEATKMDGEAVGDRLNDLEKRLVVALRAWKGRP